MNDVTQILSQIESGDLKAATPPLEHDADVQQVAFSPDGRLVKVVCVDGTIRVWDSLAGTPAVPLLKHAGAIAASSFSRDGSHLLAAAGKSVWLWPIGWPEFEQVTIALPESPVSGGSRTNKAPAMEALAIARLLAGNRAGYEQACVELTSLEGRTGVFFLFAPLLIPRNEDYWEQITELTEERLARIGVNAPPTFQTLSTSVEALLAFRCGDHKKVMQLLGERPNPNLAMELLVLAMAHQRADQSDEAIRLFELATEAMRNGDYGGAMVPGRVSTRPGSQSWVSAAIVELLHREARQMIHGEPPESDSDEEKAAASLRRASGSKCLQAT